MIFGSGVKFVKFGVDFLRGCLKILVVWYDCIVKCVDSDECFDGVIGGSDE